MFPYQKAHWLQIYSCTGKDSVELGEQIQFGIAFKNISLTSFDSLKISLKIIDKNNVTHIIPFPKAKPLISGDTIKIVYNIDSKDYPGSKYN